MIETTNIARNKDRSYNNHKTHMRGLTVETVIRAIKDLEHENVLKITSGKIFL